MESHKQTSFEKIKDEMKKEKVTEECLDWLFLRTAHLSSCFSHVKAHLRSTNSLFKIFSQQTPCLTSHSIQTLLFHLSPENMEVLCMRSAAAHPEMKQHANNSRVFWVFFLLLHLSHFTPFLPSSSFWLSVRQKRTYVTRWWSLHVLGHIFTQHAFQDYSTGPPAVEKTS